MTSLINCSFVAGGSLHLNDLRDEWKIKRTACTLSNPYSFACVGDFIASSFSKKARKKKTSVSLLSGQQYLDNLLWTVCVKSGLKGPSSSILISLDFHLRSDARTVGNNILTQFFNKVNEIKKKFMQQQIHILFATQSGESYWRCNLSLDKTLSVTIYSTSTR